MQKIINLSYPRCTYDNVKYFEVLYFNISYFHILVNINAAANFLTIKLDGNYLNNLY